MELINYDEIMDSFPFFKYLGGKRFLSFVFRVIKWQEFERQYQSLEKTDDPVKFAALLLKKIEVTEVVKPEDLANIPETGQFIVMANHPFGAIDGLMLAKIIGGRRPDVRILVNDILKRIKPLDKIFITVNPFDGKEGVGLNIAGMRQAMEHVKKGNSLAVFPAGQVSSISNWKFEIADIKWKGQIARMCKQLQVPIIPVYFDGKNSFWFHALGLIHPILRTMKIPSELLNKRGAKIPVKIGKPIMPEEFNHLKTEQEIGDFFRSKTYALK